MTTTALFQASCSGLFIAAVREEVQQLVGFRALFLYLQAVDQFLIRLRIGFAELLEFRERHGLVFRRRCTDA